MKLFSGTANQNLAIEVAKSISVPMANSEVVRFGNSEIKVVIKDTVKNEDCFVIQPTSNPTDTHLMELFFFADALKRSEAKKIVGIIPYFGYARQNREHQKGESVSANVIIRFLETIGFDEIYTIDLHDEGTEGIFTIPFKNLSALPILARKVRDDYGKNVVVVSPDQGGVERARSFAKEFYSDKNMDISVIEKKRDLNKIHQSKALNLFGEVKDKTVVLVDDIITSGGTLINAANLCLERGAKKVIAAVTHHDFNSEAVTLFEDSSIEKLYTTNTIELANDQSFSKLIEVSVAHLLGEEIQ